MATSSGYNNKRQLCNGVRVKRERGHACGCVLTRGLVKGVAAQSERDAALVAAEAAAVEEPALGADALQHVDPLAAEVALLAVHRLPVDT